VLNIDNINIWGRMPHYWSSNFFLESTFHYIMDFMKEIEDLAVRVMDCYKGNDDSI
jgi:hypothetical protein